MKNISANIFSGLSGQPGSMFWKLVGGSSAAATKICAFNLIYIRSYAIQE
jgi:hypothetical protein